MTARTATEIADVALTLRTLGTPGTLEELCAWAARTRNERWFRLLLSWAPDVLANGPFHRVLPPLGSA